MGTDMGTENSNLSNASHPTKRAWVGPLARRVAATLIICALIFIGLSQLIVPAVREPNFRDIPPGLHRPLMALPQTVSRHEIIYFDSKTWRKNRSNVPQAKTPPVPADNYKLHLDQ